MKRVLIILIIGSLALPSLAQRRGGQQQTIQRGSAFSQETIIIRPYQIVREEIIITPDMLVADRRRMYQGGRELSQAEVRAIMTNTDALRLYNRSLRKNRTGNIVLYCGLGSFGIGMFTLFMGHPNVSGTNERRYDWGMYWYDRSWNSGATTAGGIIMGVGFVTTIVGLSINRSSRDILRESADSFNRGLHNPNQTKLDLRFDVTPNGVGLVLNF